MQNPGMMQPAKTPEERIRDAIMDNPSLLFKPKPTSEYHDYTQEQKDKFNEALRQNPGLMFGQQQPQRYQPQGLMSLPAWNQQTPEQHQMIKNAIIENPSLLYHGGNVDQYNYDKAIGQLGTRANQDFVTRTISESQNMSDIPTFIEQTWEFYQKDPEGFQTWADENPLWAGRFFANIANPGRQRHSLELARDLTGFGMGPSFMYDIMLKHAQDPYSTDTMSWQDYEAEAAKYLPGLASNFNQSDFKDINNPSGADFFKIGDPSNTSRHGSLLDYVTQNPFEVALQVGGALLAPQAIGALQNMGYTAGQASAIVGAGKAAVDTAIQGGDMTDVLKSAGVSAVTSGLSSTFTDLVNAGPGVISGAIEGATAEAVQGLANGEFSVENIATSGLFGAAGAGAKDAFQDMLQTSSREVLINEHLTKAGHNILDPASIDPAALTAAQEWADSVYQTTDVGKLFGPNGELNKYFGVDSEFLSTSGAQKVFDTLTKPISWAYENIPGVKTVVDSGINSYMELMGNGDYDAAIEDAAATRDKELAAIETAYMNADINSQEYREQLKAADEFYSAQVDRAEITRFQDSLRYDERFATGPDDERSPDSPLYGIHEENPYGPSGNQGSGGMGQGTLPTPPPTDSTPVTDGLFPEFSGGGEGGGDGDLLAGDEDLFEGTLPSGTGDFSDGGLPPGYYEDEVGQTESELPAGGGGAGGGDYLPGDFGTEGVIADQGEPNLLDLFQMPEIRRLPPAEQWIAVQQLMGTQA